MSWGLGYILGKLPRGGVRLAIHHLLRAATRVRGNITSESEDDVGEDQRRGLKPRVNRQGDREPVVCRVGLRGLGGGVDAEVGMDRPGGEGKRRWLRVCTSADKVVC